MAEEFTAKEKEIRFAFLEKITRMMSLMALYEPDDYDAEILAHREVQWLGEVKESVLAINQQAMEKVLEDADVETKKIYERIIVDNNKDCQKFITRYQRKVMTLNETVQYQNFVAASSPAHVNIGNNGEATIAADKVKRAQIDVDIDTEIIFDDVKSLSAEFNKVEDWSIAESHIIEKYMQKIDQWKKKLKFLKDKVRDIKKNTVVYDLDNAKLLRSESAVASLEAEIEIAVEQLEHEDSERCLYSLNKSRTAAIKYPQFSGLQDEDYVKFEKEIRNCFRVNRVRLDDQVSCLRENLRGEALSLIPVTMVNIEDSFKTLSTVYGDPSRVMKSRKAKINSMGSFIKLASVKTGIGVQSQIQWLIKLENCMQDMFDLAETSSDMDREVFNQSTFNSIMKLFPLEVHMKMADEIGDIKELTTALFNYVVNKKEVLQKTLKTLDQNCMHSHIVYIPSLLHATLDAGYETDAERLEMIVESNASSKEGDPGGGLDGDASTSMYNASIAEMSPGVSKCNDPACSSISYPDPFSQK